MLFLAKMRLDTGVSTATQDHQLQFPAFLLFVGLFYDKSGRLGVLGSVFGLYWTVTFQGKGDLKKRFPGTCFIGLSF
ncbi:Putative protein [Zobellia galactanivorans]|uniref:Uncharacterized protein n=1 Tax=Zobellia galactanivorans (strain DSM 12802 / CCUG 47099 / CIP 106680 / NCIMB 13871 / Dsij) TaxID=63186 RepID=G0L3L4_ZOBGA|nr:Putative protein [Zobellia galactanivorans]